MSSTTAQDRADPGDDTDSKAINQQAEAARHVNIYSLSLSTVKFEDVFCSLAGIQVNLFSGGSYLDTKKQFMKVFLPINCSKIKRKPQPAITFYDC